MQLNVTCCFKEQVGGGAIVRRRRAQQQQRTFALYFNLVIITYEREDIVNATRAITALTSEMRQSSHSESFAGGDETHKEVLQTLTIEQLAKMKTVFASSTGDPYLQHLAYGGGAKFRSADGAIHASLSTSGLAVNVCA
eukprot:6175673-Pleurochrysis_carterae.AAC.1